MQPMWNQRKILNLKKGDKAWLVSGYPDAGATYAEIEVVTITGDCLDGHGYEARRKSGEEIHTCNFEGVCSTPKDAFRWARKINVLAKKACRKNLSQTRKLLHYLELVTKYPTTVEIVGE